MMKICAIGSVIKRSGLLENKSGLVITMASTIDGGQAMAARMALAKDLFHEDDYKSMLDYQKTTIEKIEGTTDGESRKLLIDDIVGTLRSTYGLLHKTSVDIAHEYSERDRLIREQNELINTLSIISQKGKPSQEPQIQIPSKVSALPATVHTSSLKSILVAGTVTSDLSKLMKARASLLTKTSTGLVPKKASQPRVNIAPTQDKSEKTMPKNGERKEKGKEKEDALTMSALNSTTLLNKPTEKLEPMAPTKPSNSSTITTSSIFHAHSFWKSDQSSTFSPPRLENDPQVENDGLTRGELEESNDLLRNANFAQSDTNEFVINSLTERQTMIQNIMQQVPSSSQFLNYPPYEWTIKKE
jgi:hypothetical protein